MTIMEEVQKVQKLAEADGAGDPSAHHKLLKAIRALQLAAETPLETTSRLNFQSMQNICVRVAVEKNLLHAIAARDGKPVSAKELHQETGTDLLLIIRVLRVLTSIGLAEEVGEDLYAANENTKFKIQKGSIGMEKHHFDLDFALGGRLVDYMRGPGIHQFADHPGDTTLFNFTFGTQSIFGLLQKNPEQKDAFDSYMAARRLDGSQQWFDIYPAVEKFKDFRNSADAVLMVDIGGGPGQELVRFKQAHPDQPGRLILEDLALTLRRHEDLPKEIEPLEYDFFTPQPVKGARAYFLRDVLHNWSDARSAQILTRVVEAMDAQYSTLLIDDYVLPPTGADLRAAEMDILMWLHTSGLERTTSQWEKLLDSVGLQIEKIWSPETGYESVLEVKKRQS